MKTEKSLCESCSNRVVIKFQNEESKYHKKYCFFDIVEDKWSSKGNKVLESIVDECSFHNKTIYFKQIKPKKIKEQDSDDDINEDYGTDSQGNRMYGVTFTNIPGALLP